MGKMKSVLAIVMIVGGSALSLIGCAAQPSAPDPTTRPLNDPMGYSPSFDNDSVTGNKGDNFDSNAFNRDVNHVLNP
jgi:hypothetical protein